MYITHTKLLKVTSEDDKITWEGLALSPDEKWIAVASAKGSEESVDIYLKNIETPRLIQRSFSPRNEIHPAFSPDGKKLAFSGWNGTDWDIYITGGFSGTFVQPINHPDHNLHPNFSPDGNEIVFTSNLSLLM